MPKPGSLLPERTCSSCYPPIIGIRRFPCRWQPSLVLLDFDEITADLMHRVISNEQTLASKGSGCEALVALTCIADKPTKQPNTLFRSALIQFSRRAASRAGR